MKNYLLVFFVFSAVVHNAQTIDASGKKQGYWKKKDEKTGKLLYEGEFKDNKPVGTFKHYYPGDTAKRAVTYYKDGGKIAYANLYHQMTGKLMAQGKYIHELKDSVWNFYDDKGVIISKDIYKMGKKEGKSIVYLPDGTVSEEKNYKNDILEGPFVQYFDGKLKKGEGKYVNGKFEGKVTYYYPNGKFAATGIYKNGMKEGVWLYNESDGKLKDKELYRNGIQVKGKEAEEYFKKNKIASEAPAAKTNTTSSPAAQQKKK